MRGQRRATNFSEFDFECYKTIMTLLGSFNVELRARATHSRLGRSIQCYKWHGEREATVNHNCLLYLPNLPFVVAATVQAMLFFPLRSWQCQVVNGETMALAVTL